MTDIDVFNDRYQHQGTADKREAHRQGLWHRTFSALVVNPATRRVILQKKSPDRYSFERPDYADFSVGGHYHAGETIDQGVREVHEELGLPITYPDLHPLGVRQTAVTLAPDYLEREFQHWHLLPLAVSARDIPLADAEVSGLVELDLDDAINLATGDTDTVPAAYTTRTQRPPADTLPGTAPAHTQELTHTDGQLQRADLVPNYLRTDQIYLRLFLAASRYCQGERTHLFW